MPCKSMPNLILWTLVQTGRLCPLVSGLPGCMKSRTAEAFARAVGRQCYALIGSLRTPEGCGRLSLSGPRGAPLHGRDAAQVGA